MVLQNFRKFPDLNGGVKYKVETRGIAGKPEFGVV